MYIYICICIYIYIHVWIHIYNIYIYTCLCPDGRVSWCTRTSTFPILRPDGWSINRGPQRDGWFAYLCMYDPLRVTPNNGKYPKLWNSKKGPKSVFAISPKMKNSIFEILQTNEHLGFWDFRKTWILHVFCVRVLSKRFHCH